MMNIGIWENFCRKRNAKWNTCIRRTQKAKKKKKKEKSV